MVRRRDLRRGGATVLTDTIVSGNAGIDSDIDASRGGANPGTLSGTYNLIGSDGSGQFTNGVGGNQVFADADLGTLGNYGGPTQTIPLLPDSLAIGAGTTVSGLTTDQRGLIRGNTVDIGAFQTSLVVESPSAAVVTTATGLTPRRRQPREPVRRVIDHVRFRGLQFIADHHAGRHPARIEQH